MKSQHISRKGAMAHGALLAYLAPKLAQDAKIDLSPLVMGKFNKSAIAIGLQAATAGKLAMDADINDVKQLLDAIDGIAVDEWPDEKDEDDKKKKDDEDDKKAKDKKKAKGAKDEWKDDDDDDDDKKKKKEDVAEDEEDDEDDEEEKKRKKEAAEAAKDKKAKDKAMDMVTKPAMDAAIAAAVKTATEFATLTQREIRDAERAVRPYVGDLAMAHDSAQAVYTTALKSLGVKIDGIHPSALPTILSMQPLPGVNKKPVVAMDAASAKSFSERYPDVARIGVL